MPLRRLKQAFVVHCCATIGGFCDFQMIESTIRVARSEMNDKDKIIALLDRPLSISQ